MDFWHEFGLPVESKAVTNSRPTDSRIPELDGFRAIAISWVFVMHVFYASELPASGITWIPTTVRVVISHGWLGVDLFFMLSGLLITGVLLDARDSSHFFRNFYLRRALRILPLYFACIMVLWLAYQGGSAYFGLSLLFMANFAHLFHILAPKGATVFWSLAVEEHFYLLWPLVVYFMPRRFVLSLCIFLVLGSPLLRGLCAHWGMSPEYEIYSYSVFRFDGLALGAMLAIWIRSAFFTRTCAWRLVSLFLGSSLLVTVIGWPLGLMDTKTVASAALRYTQAELVFASALVLALAYRGTRLTSFLRSRVGYLVASLSYCVYLIHLAVIDLYVHLVKYVGFVDTAVLGYMGAEFVRLAVIWSCPGFVDG